MTDEPDLTGPGGLSGFTRTLVIGIGNRDRGDDGVAFEVINALRRRLGQVELSEDEFEWSLTPAPIPGGETEASIASVFAVQLAPEWLDAAADRSTLILVDAHVRPDEVDLCCRTVRPDYATAAFTHHMTPEMFVALLQALYHRQPAGFLVSLKGHCFEFGRGLSRQTAAHVELAVDRILDLAAWGAKSH